MGDSGCLPLLPAQRLSDVFSDPGSLPPLSDAFAPGQEEAAAPFQPQLAAGIPPRLALPRLKSVRLDNPPPPLESTPSWPSQSTLSWLNGASSNLDSLQSSHRLGASSDDSAGDVAARSLSNDDSAGDGAAQSNWPLHYSVCASYVASIARKSRATHGQHGATGGPTSDLR